MYCVLLLFLFLPLITSGQPNIKNLHNYVSSFPSCLVHILNYEGVNLGSFSSPIVLTRYIPLRTPKHFRKRDAFKALWFGSVFPDISNYTLYPYEYSSQSHFVKYNTTDPDPIDKLLYPAIDNTFRARWYCLVWFYLLPPPPKCEIVKNGAIQVEESSDPSIQYYSMDNWNRATCQQMDPNKRNFRLRELSNQWESFWRSKTRLVPFGIENGQQMYPDGQYRILVRRSNNESSKSEYRWQNWLSNTPSVLWTGIPSTAHILTYNPVLEQIIPESLTHVCIFCDKHKVAQLLSPNVRSQRYNFRSLLEQDILWMEKHDGFARWTYKMPKHVNMKTNRLVLLNQLLADGHKFSFLRVKDLILAEPDSVEVILLSITLASRQANLSSWLPQFIIGSQAWIYQSWNPSSQSHIASHPKQYYGFITCGGLSLDAVNFWGYIAAFDIMTWVFVILFYVAFGLFLSIIAKYAGLDELVVGQWKEIRIFYIGLRVLLEQGDDVALNNKKIGFMYGICGVWMLMAIVISNAYKGDNITKITAPKTSHTITNFQEMVESEANFTIYTKHVTLPKKNRDSKSCTAKWQLTMTVGPWAFYDYHSEFHGLATNEMNKIWFQGPTKDKDFVMFTQTLYKRAILYEFCDKFAHDNFTFLNILQECGSIVYMDWDVELKRLWLQLHYAVNRKYKSAISMATHNSVYRVRGWGLGGYIGKTVIQNVAKLQDSGLMNQWRNIKVFLWEQRKKKSIQAAQSEHPPLGIHSNISTVFLVLLGGCAVAFFSMTVELLILCLSTANSKVRHLHRVFKVGSRIVNEELKQTSYQQQFVNS